MSDKIRDWLLARYPCRECESPIEHLLYAGYKMMEERSMLPLAAGMKFSMQAEVGPYRADFLITLKGADGKEKHLVVEADGHEFHERTKEQAAKDRSRDRWMTTHNYEVLRFTGSEIWANPFACAQQVLDRQYMLHYGKDRKSAVVAAGLEAITAIIEGR